jgi:hypothetical protein
MLCEPKGAAAHASVGTPVQLCSAMTNTCVRIPTLQRGASASGFEIPCHALDVGQSTVILFLPHTRTKEPAHLHSSPCHQSALRANIAVWMPLAVTIVISTWSPV